MHALDFLCRALVTMQVLMNMPENLLVTVLRSSMMTLLKQLNRLPSGLHMAALNASHPSIAAEHSLRLEIMKGVLRKQDAEALGRIFARLSSLQHPDLHGNSLGTEGAIALGPHLAGLLSLQHLDIGSNDIGYLGARALGLHLANLSSLRHF